MKTHKSKIVNFFLLTLDFVMILLVIINLGMLALQYNFESDSIRPIIMQYLPWLYEFYFPFYQNFIFIDSIFVAIFLLELTTRWFFSILNKTYSRWFMYPIIHWYDVLGCIPVGAFRFLRIFRLLSITIRLQKLGLIDVKKWWIMKFIAQNINIILQEISDAVVVNVIEKSQKEIAKGVPLSEKITKEVILPRKSVIAEYLSHRIQKVSLNQLEENREELKSSIRESIVSAMKSDSNIRLLEQIPIVGKSASSALQASVFEITYQTINNMLEKLGTEESKILVEKITDSIIELILVEEEDQKLKDTFVEMVLHSLELVKQDVKKQEWKYTPKDREALKRQEEEIREKILAAIG